MIVLETVEWVLGLVVPNMVMLKIGNVELRNLHPCLVKIIIIHSRSQYQQLNVICLQKNQHQEVVEGLLQMLKVC